MRTIRLTKVGDAPLMTENRLSWWIIKTFNTFQDSNSVSFVLSHALAISCNDWLAGIWHFNLYYAGISYIMLIIIYQYLSAHIWRVEASGRFPIKWLVVVHPGRRSLTSHTLSLTKRNWEKRTKFLEVNAFSVDRDNNLNHIYCHQSHWLKFVCFCWEKEPLSSKIMNAFIDSWCDLSYSNAWHKILI